MIVALDGMLENRSTDSIVIRVGLISFQVNVPNSTIGRLGTIGDKVHLYTYLYLREDNIALYGFASPEELGFFKSLISVTGIGPKAALALLSTFSPEQLVSAISNSNIDLISQVPGIGKKTAGHIVLVLKAKLTKGVVETVMPELQKQDADVVAFIYRDEVYNQDENNPQKGMAEIILAKQRNGPTGRVMLTFLDAYTRFENLAPEEMLDHI